MNIKKAPQALVHLWEKKYFDGHERTFSEIKKTIGGLGCNPADKVLAVALLRSKKFLTRRGSKGNYRYIQKHAAKGITLTEEVFPDQLVKKLGADFKTEIDDLNHNYGKSGTCTAFLLRKILEKLIFLAFAHNGVSNNLEDKNGDLVGLKVMLGICASTKIKGKPFLMQKTAKEIDGIKFLGDTSAHNPLTNVDMKTIVPQMPFIVTAYEELASKL